MSKLYHDPADKAAERTIAAQLARKWHCEISEFPALSPIDWFLHRGPKLCALAEVKQKRRAFEQYPSVHLDVLKYWPLLSGGVAFGVPSFYVVQCTDGLYCAQVQALVGFPVSVIGRRDRLDPLDVEPCIAIPLRMFKAIRLEEPCLPPTAP